MTYVHNSQSLVTVEWYFSPGNMFESVTVKLCQCCAIFGKKFFATLWYTSRVMYTQGYTHEKMFNTLSLVILYLVIAPCFKCGDNTSQSQYGTVGLNVNYLMGGLDSKLSSVYFQTPCSFSSFLYNFPGKF